MTRPEDQPNNHQRNCHQSALNNINTNIQHCKYSLIKNFN